MKGWSSSSAVVFDLLFCPFCLFCLFFFFLPRFSPLLLHPPSPSHTRNATQHNDTHQAHCFEWVLLHDTFIGYDDKGRVLPVTEMKPRSQDFSFSRSQLARDGEHSNPSSLKTLPIPRLLSWDLSGPAVDDILKAVEEVRDVFQIYFVADAVDGVDLDSRTPTPTTRLARAMPRWTFTLGSTTRTARA